MFGNQIGTGLTFTKVLSGLSKTLNVANQVIPLYREAKPMIQNAKTILSVFKGMNSSNSTSNSTSVASKKETTTDATPIKITPSNNPQFFL